MKTLILALMVGAQAQAAIVGVVPLANGASLRLHDTAGMCVGDALLVEYASIGKPVIPGCWLQEGPIVRIILLDGDSGKVRAADVKKPETV